MEGWVGEGFASHRESGCREDWIWLRGSPYYKVPAGMGAWVK